MQAFTLLFLGLFGPMIAVTVLGGFGYLLLPLGALVVVHAARDLQLTVYHHCAHGNGVSPRFDPLIGELISTVLVIERFGSYRKRHVFAHHGRLTISTVADATVLFLLEKLNQIPGASADDNRRAFVCSLLCPGFHWSVLRDRLNSQFGSGSWKARTATGAYLASMIALAWATGLYIPVLICWLLPLTIGYQIAQACRLMVEHHWPSAASVNSRRISEECDDLTVAIRCAVPVPDPSTSRAWAVWTLEMSFNIAIRCLVLPGDSGPSHAWHHQRARGDWPNHIRAAAKLERERLQKGLSPMPEAWGYRAALQLALESYSKATPASLALPNKEIDGLGRTS